MPIEETHDPVRTTAGWIERCRSGDHSAFEPIVRAYEDHGRRVALGILRDEAAAEDAVQEAFVKAYGALDRFEDGRDFRPWFLRIVRNHCRDVLRRAKARPELERITPLMEERVASSEDAGRESGRRAAADLLWAGLGRISVDHREVLVLKELEGLGYDEIAATLGVPEGTVASRLYHARRALRKVLDEMGVKYP